jgi:hypothetical protein
MFGIAVPPFLGFEAMKLRGWAMKASLLYNIAHQQAEATQKQRWKR